VALTLDVLHVITDNNRRGAQLFATDLHREFVNRGASSDVVAMKPGTLGAPIDVPVLDGSAASRLVTLRRKARDASVVIAHGSSTLRACALALAGTDTPFVYRSIGDPLFWANTWRRRRSMRALLSRAEGTVALWEGGAVALRSLGVSPNRIHVIPQASSLDRFRVPQSHERPEAREALALDPDADVVAFIGALSSEKRPQDAIEAVARMGGASLIVAGDGPLRAPATRLAADRLGSRVTFLGEVADVRRVLVAADLLILTSESEGMPGVAIEAGLTARPVVATDVGGTADIVLDGITGFLVPARSIQELGRGLERALMDRCGLGDRARDWCAGRFDISEIAAQWQAVVAGVRKA
jgi:glycosyltransferase involved in cell wall biosynthesis